MSIEKFTRWVKGIATKDPSKAVHFDELPILYNDENGDEIRRLERTLWENRIWQDGYGEGT